MRTTCPICKADFKRPPASSRFKKRTMICEACGVAESISSVVEHQSGIPKAKSWKEHKRRVMVVRESFTGDDPDRPIDLNAIITGERTIEEE